MRLRRLSIAAGRGLAGALLLAACGSAKGSAPNSEDVPVPRLTDVDSDVVAAIESARDDVLREPHSADAWGRLGNRYFLHDFLPEAARCFARAEELDPERVVWSYRRGLCSIDDDPAEAARHLEHSLLKLADHAPAHENYASVLWRLGREEEAIEHLVRASELDPRAAQPETGLGQIYLARGELEPARAHLEAAVARDPRQAEAHAALAQVYLGLGQEEKAEGHAQLSRTLPQASQRDDVYATPSLPPAGARARTRHGKQLERHGQLEEAAEEYRAALAGNPDYYAARSSLAKLLVELGRRDEAVELLREALRRNPEFEQARIDLAHLSDPEAAPVTARESSLPDSEE